MLHKLGNKTANINIKKQQFIHSVNGDGSKSAKKLLGLKDEIILHQGDIQAMWWWVISSFLMIFAVFDSSPLTLKCECVGL